MLEPPATPKDVSRMAHVLINRHGHDADLVAAAFAQELHDDGDGAGNLAWNRVVSVIAELIGDVPPRGADAIDWQ